MANLLNIIVYIMIKRHLDMIINFRRKIKWQKKIVQTAGRDALGKFAPDFAEYNDDILFGKSME